MRAVELPRFGRPAEVVRLSYVDERTPDEDEDVVVEVVAAPIDPMDLLVARGLYPMLPRLPAVMGAEGCVRVVQGSGIAPGTLALLPVRFGSWAERLVVSRHDLLTLPPGTDPTQASMWRVNGLTALALLEGVEPGEWIVSAPGTGGVTQHLVQIARSRGIHSACLTRRPKAHAEHLRGLGADLVLADDMRAIGQVREAASGSRLRFAFDGVGGATTSRLAACLDNGATVTAYGAMSGRPAQLGIDDAVFRDIRLRGFWLWRWVEGRDLTAEIERLAALSLRCAVASVYRLDAIHEALLAAEDPDRFGRVVLRPTD